MVAVSLGLVVTPLASAAVGAATCSHRLDADSVAVDDAEDTDAGAGS